MKFFYKLKSSTKIYLIGLIASFLGLLDINYKGIESIVLIRIIAFANVVFGIMAIVAIICLLVGASKSFKEITKNKQKDILENKWWYRFVKVLWYLSYPIFVIYILNSDQIEQKFIVPAIYLFIFFARFVAHFVGLVFLYIIYGEKN